MWLDAVHSLEPGAVFSQPATPGELEAIEAALSIQVPNELRDLLTETNGIEGSHGLGLVWPADRILKDNLSFRSSFAELFMSFESLLFFADAGNGDQFAFPIRKGQVGPDVFVWDHEDDSRRWYAASLLRYLEWWLSGDHSL